MGLSGNEIGEDGLFKAKTAAYPGLRLVMIIQKDQRLHAGTPARIPAGLLSETGPDRRPERPGLIGTHLVY